MAGHFIDILRTSFRKGYQGNDPSISLIDTNYGRVRVFDTKGNKPVIINVPDGPNVIEHQIDLIAQLSKRFRVICFEYPGFGFSYPNRKYNYSLNSSAGILLELMEILKVETTSLLFSCANGFYAIKASELDPGRINHLFLAQTPSLHSMANWVETTIPKVLRIPVVGQVANSFLEKQFARSWYKYALPKGCDISGYQNQALTSLKQGSCFCLSGMVQGLSKDMHANLNAMEVPATLVWGKKDFTHQKTDPKSIIDHVPNCEIIEFEDCGHFPELENTKQFVALVNERIG